MGKGFHNLFWICGIIYAVSLISAVNDKGAFYAILIYGIVLAALFGVLLFVFFDRRTLVVFYAELSQENDL